MGNDEPWDVLWTGAYESTAFITALLVGAFSFIPDPTGYQDATDAAEILVYTYWRYAIVVVGLDILFKVIVLVVQWANGVRAYTIVWTLLLMMAPWAPLLNKVVAAVLAWGSVRSLMCNRVTRNEVSCVLREYLRMGDQSLTTAAATEMVVGVEARFGMPSKVLQDAVRRLRDSRSHCESKEYEEKVQTLLKNVENYGISVWMLTRRARRQEPLSRLRGHHSWRLWLRRADKWTGAWTREEVRLVADPFPPERFSRLNEPHQREGADGGRQPRMPLSTRAYVLDVIDDCHRGYTLSQKHTSTTLPENLCKRCTLAFRGAIETFLESSTRAHEGVQAREWLFDTQMDWLGGFDKVADGLWEVAFAYPVALRVDDGDLVDDYGAAGTVQKGPNPTVTTRKFLVFLFLIARSLLSVCKPLESVGEHVSKRLHSRDWWHEYWTAVLAALRKDRNHNETYDDWMDGIRSTVMRDLTAAEMRTLVRLLADHPMRQQTGKNADGKEQAMSGAYCNESGCTLNSQTAGAAAAEGASVSGRGGRRRRLVRG